MKDGCLRLGHKAAHVVGLPTEVVLSANVYHAHRGDTDSLSETDRVNESYFSAESLLLPIIGEVRCSTMLQSRFLIGQSRTTPRQAALPVRSISANLQLDSRRREPLRRV